MQKKLKVLKKGVKLTGKKFPRLMYGLDGIAEIFDCSRSTAMRYKNGFLKDAVTQRGNKIIVDTKRALECFGMLEKDAKRFIKD